MQKLNPDNCTQARKLPEVRACIKNIESVGWTFSHCCGRVLYVFNRNQDKADWAGVRSISFSLAELRHAFLYGW